MIVSDLGLVERIRNEGRKSASTFPAGQESHPLTRSELGQRGQNVPWGTSQGKDARWK